ncbi:hypothetical protein FE257_004394 [Aspergillus nanangensis]|uniref:C2H2-type domain-containing protein n=1 Tax=Aspergillus nanangensis TaxID=2582783 RepID=A0AAD4CYG3_ASPNN|nr:hypothetical protein FE257_004394 [Aspergillus nanangensis]
MRRTSAPTEISLPITYTPTTHRISKAKKGKRVHACEYPGCDKVFTRAEHRRRHELNHNPEALFRCSRPGCKKAFHRPDLLARHMERHDLEAQMDHAQWNQQTQIPLVSEPPPATPYVTKCAPSDPHTASYLAVTQAQNSMSIGSIVGPAIHPELVANDCGMIWSGLDMHPDPQSTLYPGHQQQQQQQQQPHIHESVEDTGFYATPDTCPSPLSDGPTLSIPSHSRSSVCSTPVAMVDTYPENIMDSELTSSPVPMHTNIRCWEQTEGQNISNMVPLSLNESLIHSSLQCQYPQPTWPTSQTLSYDEQQCHLPPAPQYQTPMPWKSWST